jgi:hypothetical protein
MKLEEHYSQPRRAGCSDEARHWHRRGIHSEIKNADALLTWRQRRFGDDVQEWGGTPTGDSDGQHPRWSVRREGANQPALTRKWGEGAP